MNNAWIRKDCIVLWVYKYKIAILTYVLYNVGSWLMKTSSKSSDLQEDKYEESSMCYVFHSV